MDSLRRRRAALLALVTLLSWGASKLPIASAQDRPMKISSGAQYKNREYTEQIRNFHNMLLEGAKEEAKTAIPLDVTMFGDLDTSYNAVQTMNGYYPYDDLNYQDIASESEKAIKAVERMAYNFASTNEDKYRPSNFINKPEDKEMVRKVEDRYLAVNANNENKEAVDNVFRTIRGEDRYAYPAGIEWICLSVIAGGVAAIRSNYYYEERENGSITPANGRAFTIIDGEGNGKRVLFFAIDEAGDLFTEYTDFGYNGRAYTHEEIREIAMTTPNVIEDQETNSKFNYYGLIREANDVENKAIQSMESMLKTNVNDKQREQMNSLPDFHGNNDQNKEFMTTGKTYYLDYDKLELIQEPKAKALTIS